ncbi:hypothetical protein FRC03_000077 [Tulasnella sp. 419]|nr:hypothetical protein FRC03_000077 [Tulasnella sp. 419]
MKGGTLKLSPATTPLPFDVLVTASYLGTPIVFDPDTSQPVLEVDGTAISDPADIINNLTSKLLPTNPSNNVQHTSFISLAKSLATASSYADVVAALDSLDDHLLLRSFLVGYSITAADFSVWGALKGNVQALGILKRNGHIHISRWYSFIESIPSTQSALNSLAEARANKARSTKVAASFSLGLPNAVEGKVVTRFPPEPSGYLHIGHTKAAILNQYFAAMYKGRMLIRFDDTNPSKEKTEFEDTILQDLELLDIRGDAVSHTSDHFDALHRYAVEIIKSGNAYADDTLQLQMREERMNGIASKRRDTSVEENLKRFEEMATGSEEGAKWCIRAKISVDNPNKAMRDPVIYRVNTTPHHRTGDKWKIYPTYDFACPIVDSIEGVTHALRTNEYRDRNPQYQWMLEALKLRKVDIWDFSRVNFVYTLLSKRKLTMFVDKEVVHGWDDPRFPTVRGIRRRGMTIEALKQYMLSQGPSQAVLLLEWDGIWATNKKIIDPIAPRFTALAKENLVTVHINGQSGVTTQSVPRHKKNPDVGTKTTVYSPVIYIEQEDASSFEDNEEITLMDWGNAIVKSKQVSDSGQIASMTMDLYLEGDFKKTKKKITWLAESSSANPLVNVTLLDYDYLITKKKLEEEDDVFNFVTPVSEFKSEALADANVITLSKGDIIQFERKGYYIVDAVKPDKTLDLIRIPDGKMASLASKVAGSTPVEPVQAIPKAKSSKKGPANELAPRKEGFVDPDGNRIMLSEGKSGFEIPVTTKMYDVKRVFGETEVQAAAETKMYSVKSVYDR